MKNDDQRLKILQELQYCLNVVHIIWTHCSKVVQII